MNDVYCSTKFQELEVHIQSRLLYNCCKAYPERIDLNWLDQNPGQLFNTPNMVTDRKLMLAGERCESCDWGCYSFEDKGLASSRNDLNDREKANPKADLKKLKIALSTDCNLTCSYCSAEWSTAWSNDLSVNGDYPIQGYSNQNTNWQKLWMKIKQKDRGYNTKFFDLLKREIALTPTIEEINLLGGEPLLNNNLPGLLDSIQHKKVVITTGLGISPSRLDKILPKIKSFDNVILHISVEATGKLFEFLRYGCSWNNFQKNLDTLLLNGIKCKFSAVVCNLSSFGLIDFYQYFKKLGDIIYNPISDRPFMDINVLDDRSKSDFKKNSPSNQFFEKAKRSLYNPFDIKQKNDLKIFLLEFSRRRDLDPKTAFPIHFLEWLGVN